MNLVVFGSRSLSGDAVRAIILDELSRYQVREVTITTSGGTPGACQVAREVAKDLKLPLLVRWADSGRYAKGAYDHRSKAILRGCDSALFIWDGKSRGTKNEVALADKMRVPYRLVTMAHASQGADALMPDEVAGMLPLSENELAVFSEI